MRIHGYISVILSLVLLQTFICCKTSPEITFKVTGLDTTIKTTKISIADLARNYKSYQGQYIETKGRFFFGFENVAIYADNIIATGDSRGFWLDINRDLNMDNTWLEKMNRKLITVKGRIDTTNKGHLSAYFATIDDIYFWQY
jgi:hypothetical protein